VKRDAIEVNKNVLNSGSREGNLFYSRRGRCK
jgi:hypothetical protein